MTKNGAVVMIKGPTRKGRPEERCYIMAVGPPLELLRMSETEEVVLEWETNVGFLHAFVLL